MILTEMAAEMRRLNDYVEEALETLGSAPHREATAETKYRKERSVAYSLCPEGYAAQRDAWVDAETADARLERDQAKNAVMVARESLRARLAQLSALQSLLAAHKSEAQISAYGPESGP